MACSTGEACGFTETRSGASRWANHSAVIRLTIDALDAWWPPTFTPDRFSRTRLAWCTIEAASQSTRRWTRSSACRSRSVRGSAAVAMRSAYAASRCSPNGEKIVGRARSRHRPHVHHGTPAVRATSATVLWAWWASSRSGETSSSTRSSAISRSTVADSALRAANASSPGESASGGSWTTSSKPARSQASVTSARRRSSWSGRPSEQARLMIRCPASRRPSSVAPAPSTSSSGCGERCRMQVTGARTLHAGAPQRGEHTLPVDLDRGDRAPARRARVVLEHDDRRTELLELAQALDVVLGIRADDRVLRELLVGHLLLAVLVHLPRLVPVARVVVLGLGALPLPGRLEGGLVALGPRPQRLEDDLSVALAPGLLARLPVGLEHFGRRLGIRKRPQ